MAKGGTPAIEMLEAADVAFTVTEFHHEPGEGNFGQVAAAALGIEPERVFKTLVANLATETGIEQVVGIVPVSGQLSLRKLASALARPASRTSASTSARCGMDGTAPDRVVHSAPAADAKRSACVRTPSLW